MSTHNKRPSVVITVFFNQNRNELLPGKDSLVMRTTKNAEDFIRDSLAVEKYADCFGVLDKLRLTTVYTAHSN